MQGLSREISLIRKKGKKTIILLLIYMIITILITFDLPKDTSPIEFMINQVFLDNGNYFNFNEYVIPISFVALHLIPVLTIAEVFYKAHLDSATYLLSKFDTKTKYFLGKFLVMSLSNLLLGFVYFAILLLYISVKGSNYYYLMLGFVRISVFYILENILFTNMVFLLAIFTNFRFSIFTFLLNIVLATITNNRLILGQGSLIMKQDFYGGEFDLIFNLIVIVGYFLIFLLLAYFSPKYYNHYGRKR